MCMRVYVCACACVRVCVCMYACMYVCVWLSDRLRQTGLEAERTKTFVPFRVCFGLASMCLSNVNRRVYNIDLDPCAYACMGLCISKAGAWTSIVIATRAKPRSWASDGEQELEGIQQHRIKLGMRHGMWLYMCIWTCMYVDRVYAHVWAFAYVCACARVCVCASASATWVLFQ